LRDPVPVASRVVADVAGGGSDYDHRMTREPAQRPRPGTGQNRRPELRTLASLPPRAKVFALSLSVALVGVLVWLTIHLLTTDSLPVAIVVLLMSYIGFAVLLVAMLTVLRAMFSLRSVPFLLGRLIYRLLTRG
jgi:hypothetical protein